MQLLSCECPVRHFDKLRNEWIYSPCGKCNSCRKVRVNNWINRLKDESKHWPFVYFFTLTYNDENLPVLRWNENHDYLMNLDYDVFISRSELLSRDDWSDIEMDYIDGDSVISFPVVRHIQLFMKKVRKRCIKYNRVQNGYYKSGEKQGEPRFIRGSFENEQIRYFIVSEQGSTTFRAHYHGLLFFRSKRTAEKIYQILSESWPYGFINVQRQKFDAASYVAKYVNSVVDLPKVYLHEKTRNFFLCSKSPFIGSLSFTEIEVRQIFDSLSCRRTVVNGKQQLVDVQYPRTLENQLFPKIQRFSHLTHLGRVALYGLARFSRATDFGEFYEWCKTECQKSKYGLTENINWITNFLQNENALKRLWYISSQVCMQCNIFQIRLGDYVRKIELYYELKDFDKLKRFYSSLEESPVTVSSLFAVDLSFRDRLVRMSEQSRKIIFESYGVYSDSYDIGTCHRLFDFYTSQDNNILVYIQKAEGKYFADKQLKTKLKKDYLFKYGDTNKSLIAWHKAKGHLNNDYYYE